MWNFFFSLSCLFVAANAQQLFPGRCPKAVAMQNFDVTKYTGLWYEYEKYFAIFEYGGKCITATYKLNNDSSVKVLNRQINSDNDVRSITGSAVLSGKPGEGKLTVNFPNSLWPSSSSDSNYWVLDTDYNSYSAVYSCTDIGIIHFKFVWLLTREKVPSDSAIKAAYKAFEKNKVDRKFLIKTEQDCAAKKEKPQF